MTPTRTWWDVTQHFKANLNSEIDWENKLLSLSEVASLPGPIYVHEQIKGDLVVIPQQSCHQVVNHGGLTIKAAWSRMSLRSLQSAVLLECPMYRRCVSWSLLFNILYSRFIDGHRVCRSEIYRSRLLCFRVLQGLLRRTPGVKALKMQATATHWNHEMLTLHAVANLFGGIIESEWHPDNDRIGVLDGEPSPTCDFCGADIFQSFFECENCFETGSNSSSPTPAYSICAGCYVEGRSCQCRVMQPRQCRGFAVLFSLYNDAAERLNQWASTTGNPEACLRIITPL